jgi:hypothetical protein
MRITVICNNGFVSINGTGYSDLDLSFLDPSIHAIQWYGTDGEVEIKDERGRMVENIEITSFDPYSAVIPLWDVADAAARQKDLEITNYMLSLAESQAQKQ